MMRIAGLMAHIIVSKFGDHLPGTREGVPLGDLATVAFTPLLEQAATRRDRVPIVLHADVPARYWPLGPARPRPAACGPMCAMNGSTCQLPPG
jgi:hypothetical protein